ncbi:sensor histidine kinase [Actinoplanes sp. NPDC051513]|uniref:sensor histidine kinase n=1 Tax=Actinoplanes sp. NPDC051513 TaxID=3363908 RepID=UPI003787C92B
MSLWAEPAAPGAPSRGWRDWALVAAFCVLAVIEGLARPSLSGGFVAVALVFLLAPTLLWRRSRPLLMVTIAFAATAIAPVLTDGVPPEAASLVFVALLPYSLLRWGSGRAVVIGVAVIAAKIVVSVIADQMTVPDALAGAAVTFAVAALGLAMRFRAVGRLREHERVRLVERERLARDLHDTVAHHVSAMAIRAQAGLALAETDPAAATDALRVIEAEATAALAEMRTVVKALRASPSPSLADLETLAAVDTRVDLGISGDLGGVAPAVGAAVFRLAQEAVTNARRHARHATRIEVRVAADDTSVHLRVTDDGEVAAATGKGSESAAGGGSGPAASDGSGPAASDGSGLAASEGSGLAATGGGFESAAGGGSGLAASDRSGFAAGGGSGVAAGGGFGLAGMRERAALLGGVCSAGPNPGRGWSVTATLPRTGPAS